MGASVIDGLILAVVSGVLRAVGGGVGGGFGVLVDLAYLTVMIGGSRGQTVGNMAVSTRVVDERTGQAIGYGRAFVRAIVPVVLFILLVVPWLLDLFWPLWDDRSQTLHDKAAKSLVVPTR